jgi:hypothetical protein
MYGMIHEFLRSTLTQICGVQVWSAIDDASGVGGVDYYGMQQYPDEIAERLVEAAARQLGQSRDETWHQLGLQWVPYTRVGVYASYYDQAGGALEFLERLNEFHAGVRQDMPLLRPPIFRLERLAQNEARLHYASEREGLGAFLRGTLLGLAELYHEAISVEEEVVDAPAAEDDLTRRSYILRVISPPETAARGEV